MFDKKPGKQRSTWVSDSAFRLLAALSVAQITLELHTQTVFTPSLALSLLADNVKSKIRLDAESNGLITHKLPPTFRKNF